MSKVSAGNDEFAQRVREKELIIASTAEYMKVRSCLLGIISGAYQSCEIKNTFCLHT